MTNGAIGLSIQRKEAWDKVTGAAKYTDDYIVPGYDIIEEWLQANICRCTSFDEIKQAIKSVLTQKP